MPLWIVCVWIHFKWFAGSSPDKLDRHARKGGPHDGSTGHKHNHFSQMSASTAKWILCQVRKGDLRFPITAERLWAGLLAKAAAGKSLGVFMTRFSAESRRTPGRGKIPGVFHVLAFPAWRSFEFFQELPRNSNIVI
jgi:hypothetical protein